MSEHESVLVAPPGDGISCVKFSPVSTSLLVSSWDSTVRLYDVSQNISKATFNLKAASLCCGFWNDEKAFAGGLDKNVHILDLVKGADSSLGSHDKGISCLEWSSANQLLFTGSWDATSSVWDPRSSAKVTSIPTTDKVFSLSITDTRVIIATAGRHILIYDVRNMSQVEQIRESPLRHQTRKVACFPDGTGYALGSIEGRVAIEYFDMDPAIQTKKYAFKCHRRGELAFPVNSLAYHPIYGTFATGGGDGLVNIWDGSNKKRLCQLHPYPTSISSMAFSHDGSILVIASSYTFEEGDKPHPEDNIYIRYIQDVDVLPRPKES
eukprot:gene2543-4959_t